MGARVKLMDIFLGGTATLILELKVQSRVQNMSQAPSFRQGDDSDRLEFLMVDWFQVKGRYLPEDEQVNALIATHPVR